VTLKTKFKSVIGEQLPMRLFWFCFLASGASASTSCRCIDESDFDQSQIIVKDVAIVGGGASGAHAAVRLREDFGKSIVLIEKKGRLVRFSHPLFSCISLHGHLDLISNHLPHLHRVAMRKPTQIFAQASPTTMVSTRTLTSGHNPRACFGVSTFPLVT